METLSNIIINNEEILAFDISKFVSEKNLAFSIFSQEKIWKKLIPAISRLLIEFIENRNAGKSEPHPDESLFKEAASRLIDANKHLKLNVDIGMLLEFIKCYKKSYIKIISCSAIKDDFKSECLQFVECFFDKVEIYFSSEWVKLFKFQLVRDFKSKHDIIIETLKKSEAKYHSLVEQASDGIFIIDFDGKFIDVNTKGHMMLGYSYEELLNLNIFNIADKTDNEKALFEFEELKSGKTIISEWKLRCKNNSVITVELSAKILPDGNIQGIIRDITQRKKMENELKESEELYRRLVSLIPDGVFMINDDKFQYMNEAGAKLLGAANSNELIGKYPLEFVHPDSIETAIYLLKHAIENEMTPGPLVEKRLLRADGTTIDIEARGISFPYKNKPVILSVYRDITERKLAEENMKLLREAIEYDKLKTEFFSNISHELRTPINVIMSALQMCDLIQKKFEGDENSLKMMKYISIMRQNCYRLIKLVNNLIDITRIDSGYLKMDFQNLDIVNIVENISLSVADYIENKGIGFTFDTELEEKTLACDPDKIERILLNLLSNSIKFTNPGGHIYVRIVDKGERIAILVKDTGIGIPDNKQKLIFERFIQVDKSLSRANEGSGIGLSLVKLLVEMHGGSISVKSKLGKGSEFIIELPVSTVVEEYNFLKNATLIQQNNLERINIEFSDIYS